MLNKKNLIIAIVSILMILPVYGQKRYRASDFDEVCKTLTKSIKARSTVRWKVELKNIMQRDTLLDFYFTRNLGDYPWYEADAEWLRDTLKKMLPSKYKHFKVGNIYSNGVHLDSLVMPILGYDGNPVKTSHTHTKPTGKYVVRQADRMKFSQGLDGRHIAIWQSHGRYFDVNTEQWRWQRPCLFQVCEDIFTQSYVLKYLVPMLENSGAYVMLPRERDTQTNEVIADNDSTFRGEGGRFIGTHKETGKWSDAGAGFADKQATYLTLENPFSMGTARKASCVSNDSKTHSTTVWRAQIPERGEYAVYVSYKTLKESTSCAHYTVHHLGGETSYIVNQTMGGGTWIYLGTFEFEKGDQGYVTLDSRTPEGYKFHKGKVVTADAVRFGGGMGNIARGRNFDPENDTIPRYDPYISGMPRSVEGSRYYLQWAGAPESVYSLNEGEHDYKDDYMSRPLWVSWMSGGSVVNPKEAGKKIPFDVSLAFHTDAGVTDGNSVIGTLAIYTLKSQGKQTLPSQEDRMTSRLLAECIQNQIVSDMRDIHDATWSRRWLWDRSYYESRVPPCPSILLELLSHQNFRDMRYGLDPKFQFDASRAVYKGILKYLSYRYEEQYTVQPLPIKDLCVRFHRDGENTVYNKAQLSWSKVDDPIEPTAVADGYVLYTRIDDGGFDNGKIIKNVTKSGGKISTVIDIEPGHVYSFKVAAYNKGGKSFAIENVSIGVPETQDASKADKVVMIVNNFDRVSGPAFYDNKEYGGFVNRKESGIAYMKDISFVGEMNVYSKMEEYSTDTNPGFGSSFSDNAGKVVAGNTFEYSHAHGKALLKLGYPFQSCSREVFCNDSTLRDETWCADIICGRQVTSVMPDNSEKFSVFPLEMQEAIRNYTSKGGNLIVSGAYIGTDVWSKLYPINIDRKKHEATTEFATKVLGYKHGGNYGSKTGRIQMTSGGAFKWKPGKYFQLINTPNKTHYCVENPDAILPASRAGSTIARYADTGAPAGVAYKGDGYRTVCYGFPIETVTGAEDMQIIMELSLNFLSEVR